MLRSSTSLPPVVDSPADPRLPGLSPTMAHAMHGRLEGLRRLVGNTPLLAIDVRFRGGRRRVYAKSENLNMTGSVKDRMALHILRTAYERGQIAPGALIVEATSGNTGISFAAVGSCLGHPVSIFMPDWMSSERVNLLRAFGAELHPVSDADGGFVGSIQLAEQAARVDGRLPAPPVLQLRQLRGSRAHHRARDSLATRVTRPEARRVRGGRRYGRHGDGRGVVPQESRPEDSRASAGARRFAHAEDRPARGSTLR